jgi:hypothetical protein
MLVVIQMVLFLNVPRFTGILDGTVLFLKDLLEYWLLFE